MCFRWLTKSKRKGTTMLNEIKAAFGRYVETVKEVIAKLQTDKAALQAEIDALRNEIDVATADLMPATPPFEPSGNA